MIEKRIVLIDGNELTKLLVQHGVGVAERARYQVYRLDEEYFGQ
jgi:restriction system protein